MIFPTVHLNGTSKNDLLEQLSDAHYALHLAQKALANAGPNGRDYYPQGPDVIFAAMEEHGARMSKIEAVKFELLQLMEQIDKQGERL